jgi:hypothetical protein
MNGLPNDSMKFNIDRIWLARIENDSSWKKYFQREISLR